MTAPLPVRLGEPAAGPNDPTAECAVLFVDVVRYSEQPLAAQRSIKHRINAAVRQATVRLAPGERVLLDTGDGVAIAFLGNPEDALFVALGLVRALNAPAEGRPVLLRTGINFGKISVLHDVNGQPSVIGDGINMAQRVMSFANPGQLLVSQAFYQLLIGLSEDYAGLFAYCGARTDKHVREHELYELTAPVEQIEIDLPRYMLPRTAPAGSEVAAPLPPPLVPERPPPRGSRAVWLGSAALLVGLAIAAHALRPALPPAPPQASPAPATASASAAPASPDRLVRRARTARKVPAQDVRQATAQAAPARASPDQDGPNQAAPDPDAPNQDAANQDGLALDAPAREAVSQYPAADSATLAFAIAPWGEVRVDGRSYGASPPLTHLPLPAGEHRIEIDNGVSDPYRTVVQLEPGQALRIQHNFETPRE
jgi:class 3 adenylate cyclase